jgi:hypothetical protein
MAGHGPVVCLPVSSRVVVMQGWREGVSAQIMPGEESLRGILAWLLGEGGWVVVALGKPAALQRSRVNAREGLSVCVLGAFEVCLVQVPRDRGVGDGRVRLDLRGSRRAFSRFGRAPNTLVFEKTGGGLAPIPRIKSIVNAHLDQRLTFLRSLFIFLDGFGVCCFGACCSCLCKALRRDMCCWARWTFRQSPRRTR